MTTMAADEVRLVVFDLGRVLVRISDSWDHACDIARAPFRLPQRTPEMQAALHAAMCAIETGRMESSVFCSETARIFGVEPDQIRAILDSVLIEVFPTVPQLLDELIQRGYETACLSNTYREHWETMFGGTGPCALPTDRIVHRFGSHEIGARKPDAAAYRHVETVTGYRGGQIVFFDDKPENVEAAKSHEWRAHQIHADTDAVEQIRAHLARHKVL